MIRYSSRIRIAYHLLGVNLIGLGVASIVTAQLIIGDPKPSTQPAGSGGVQLKPGEAPAIKFDQTTYDFGRSPMGRDILHEFRFTNTGNGPLEIIELKMACGCTTAAGYEKVIQPGAKGVLPVKVATKNIKSRIDKTVEVITNAPKPNDSVLLHMVGEVWVPLEAVPSSIGFGRLSTKEASQASASKSAMIINHAPGTSAPKLQNSAGVAFEGQIKEIEPGRRFELSVRLKPPLRGGISAANLQIETGLEEMPILEVPVNVYVTADVEVFPSRLALPAVRKTDLERRFTIINNSSKPMRLTEVSCTGKGLMTRYEEVKPGATYVIFLKIPKDYQIPPSGDAIHFKTDLEGAETGSIPISIATLANAPTQQSMGIEPAAGLLKLPGPDPRAPPPTAGEKKK